MGILTLNLPVAEAGLGETVLLVEGGDPGVQEHTAGSRQAAGLARTAGWRRTAGWGRAAG